MTNEAFKCTVVASLTIIIVATMFYFKPEYEFKTEPDYFLTVRANKTDGTRCVMREGYPVSGSNPNRNKPLAETYGDNPVPHNFCE
jgi:hypothetical protein